MRLTLDPTSLEDYQRFLRIKQLPHYQLRGRTAIVPDEYAARFAGHVEQASYADYQPSDFLFDYQQAITALAIRRRKFCVFADCGLGKTLIFLEFARYVAEQLPQRRSVLIVSPLMVVSQTLAEAERWYGDELSIQQIRAGDLQEWLNDTNGACPRPYKIGITNYEAMREDLQPGSLGCLILDESSMLKSHYGKWGTTCVRLGRGLDWKMACTGTPAPNDRIEYANHALFMDAFPSVNSFLARFFVNRGQTNNRWELKKHALEPFYNALSHWSIFLSNPGVYGWQDNSQPLPPINVHLHDVPLTEYQEQEAFRYNGRLWCDQIGGIGSRSVLSQLAKGRHKGKDVASHKPGFIADLLKQWPDESTIVWCLYNAEQKRLEKELPHAGSIEGSTPYEKREHLIAEFKAGKLRILIAKPKVLGFGLNLQIATRQIFSGLQDSYEMYYQAIKRSNRFGASKALDVHIPLTDIEWPMVANVLRKADRVQEDSNEQERIFAKTYAKTIGT